VHGKAGQCVAHSGFGKTEQSAQSVLVGAAVTGSVDAELLHTGKGFALERDDPQRVHDVVRRDVASAGSARACQRDMAGVAVRMQHIHRDCRYEGAQLDIVVFVWPELGESRSDFTALADVERVGVDVVVGHARQRSRALCGPSPVHGTVLPLNRVDSTFCVSEAYARGIIQQVKKGERHEPGRNDTRRSDSDLCQSHSLSLLWILLAGGGAGIRSDLAPG
jgi:hypothetical protein